uniref:Uncharacterized protein n=1 Tax=Anguilla anguilla TaxID=7936 RepID=A0A0E9UZN3_ANGAN
MTFRCIPTLTIFILLKNKNVV